MAGQSFSCCGSEPDIFNVMLVYAVDEYLSSSIYKRLAVLMRQEYGPRLQSLLQERGIYSTGTVRLQVEWNIWDMRALQEEEILWRCQANCCHSFLIITDSSSYNAGIELEQEILDMGKDREIIIMVTKDRGLNEGQDNLQGLSRALHRFCDYFSHSAGFVVRPKKATKYVKPKKFKRLVRNVMRFVKRNIKTVSEE